MINQQATKINTKGIYMEKKTTETQPTNCAFYLTKKKKYCKFPRLPGSIYCYHHIGLTNTEDYVRCPADPKHFIKKSDVEAHVKICSKTKQMFFFSNHNSFLGLSQNLRCGTRRM
eukprot:TRINITY_DN4335_c0_g1_i1.p1 TRINITY_DN4335_c0_g1~~TRINITY_DN4335_c0_g1_i1.p1  ORF type:complete len:130 (-),score=0.23 TRINITY_DN4335_c0_g1_i1:1057-1401(-)